MIVDDRGTETRYSLWADRPEDEETIFRQMLEIVSQIRGLQAHPLRQLRDSLLQKNEKERSQDIQRSRS